MNVGRGFRKKLFAFLFPPLFCIIFIFSLWIAGEISLLSLEQVNIKRGLVKDSFSFLLYQKLYNISKFIAYDALSLYSLQKLQQLQPLNDSYLHMSVKLLIKNQEWAEAIKLVEKAQKIAPFNPNYMFLRGLCSQKLGKKENALYWLKKAMEERPDYYEAQKLYFFECYYQKMNWEGISVGEKLIKQKKLFDRAALKLVSFLLENMKRKFNYSF
ncbi:tetratricopeptide repeat protein [Candidatus Riflebacteria bacterium]